MSVYKLIAEANKSAKMNGHYLRWNLLDDNRANGECVNCGKDVSVNMKPLPNEIDIGGPAVALNCGSN